MEGADRTMRPQRGNNGFKFEAKWLQEEGCEEIVRNAWSDASLRGENDLPQKLTRTMGDLKNWDTNVLGDLEKRIKTIKTELEHVRRALIDGNTVSREQLLREKMNTNKTYSGDRELMLSGCRLGIKNTTFFHAYASERKKKNTIKR
uniref:Uncharacterized protein n=1 Tax=Aegilops tauschii subsp. strangulata TaxID=200361 RepID=A0A453JHV2_AEGTS